MTSAPFFIGWSNQTPRRLAVFAMTIAAGLVAASSLLAVTLGAATDDPGAGGFGDEVALTGVMQASPYPILRLAPDGAHPAGHAVMLAGDGKIGVQAMAETLSGKAAEVRGLLLKRGDLDMIVVNSDNGIQASAASPTPIATAQNLGRWRLTGEICDGKCYSGVMRPGTGLAHKACASLCVSGGVPPVFVSSGPIEGSIFLLLADRGGGPAPAAMYDLIGLPVSLEGDVDRVGDLLIFRADWSTAKALS
jgi:hypothetical protein